MRKTLSYFVITILLFISCQDDDQKDAFESNEISIYNKDGKPVAYYNNNDSTYVIYLWDGKPVCYFLKSNEDEIYGFNGKFIGWRESGIYYDLNGKRTGFEKGALPITTHIEAIKSIKEILPIKANKEIAPKRPINSVEWSVNSLEFFLSKGRE
ncbi:MAG: 4-fold beta flower protein [Marinifilaceae bacterium]